MDFGFGNASGYYDITERPIPDHVQTSFPVDVDGNCFGNGGVPFTVGLVIRRLSLFVCDTISS